MNKLIRPIILTLLVVASAMPAVADSMVDVFCYTSAHDNGRGGLRVAWRPEADSAWISLNGRRGVVRSDFGSIKTMFAPRLAFADGQWTATWNLDAEGSAMAITASSDMVLWQPQQYLPADKMAAIVPEAIGACIPLTAIIDNDTITGFMARAPRAAIDQYDVASAAAGRRHVGRGERLVNDSVTYTGLKPLRANIKIDAFHPKKVSDMLIGVFFEDINYSADGGLYAELLQNRDFEYSAADGNKNPDWGAMYAWIVEGDDARWEIAETDPVHPNNRHYLHLSAGNGGASVKNTGYDGICLAKGETYDFSMFCRNNGQRRGNIEVRLLDKGGKVIAKGKCKANAGGWDKVACSIKCPAACDSATIEVAVPGNTQIDLDMVSLFPRHTFHNRRNGLRADLAQAIADIHPRFVRFPGGCLVHGDGLDNIYNWKETVGPLEARKPDANIWRYHQTRGLGYYEYFQFCEDMGAEPLPVVAAGVSCQNSGVAGPSHHSHDLVTSYGQMGGIPMDEMDAYVQDVLDLIEWANGDASTQWGSVRAAAGHPAPFNLKYIGIGNEDLISPVFAERFEMIFRAVKERYPEITVIGTTGPFVEGSDYEAGWALAEKLGVPMVDEHNYNSPGWYINNCDFYDAYPRERGSVYLGEYAVHRPGKFSTLETALVTALFLTNVERNSDVVRMTSYAPLLARHGHTQWNPDLIYFDASNVYPTADYEVQRLFGTHAGDTYLPTTIAADTERADVAKRLGVSTIVDSKTGETYIKVVNLLPVPVTADMDFAAAPGAKVTKTVLAGDPEAREARSVESMCSASDMASATYGPYSLTIYKIK